MCANPVQLIPLIALTAAAVSLATSYIIFKSFFDNQVVFDRRNPYQYKDKEAIQIGVSCPSGDA